VRVGNATRAARALARDVARLRTDIERYRTELRAVMDRCLDECGHRPDLEILSVTSSLFQGVAARPEEGGTHAGPPRGRNPNGGGEAAASYPGPWHLPSSGIEGAGEHVVVIGPCSEVLAGHCRTPQHGVPSSPDGFPGRLSRSRGYDWGEPILCPTRTNNGSADGPVLAPAVQGMTTNRQSEGPRPPPAS
jgi:hypothetical protein